MRNFQCDANIYINIKEVLSNGTDDPQKKVATFVKRISMLKQKVDASQRNPSSPVVHLIQKPTVPATVPRPSPPPVAAVAVATTSATAAAPPPNATVPAVAAARSVPAPPATVSAVSAVKTTSTTATKISIVNGIGHGQIAQKQQALRQISSLQTPAQMHTLKNALTCHKVSNMVNTPIASPPRPSVQNTLLVPTTTISSLLTISKTTQSPHPVCGAPQVPPLANNVSNILQTAPFAPIAPNVSNASTDTSNVPQLLDLPQRLRRNRAYSIHFAPNEELASVNGRRQSFGADILTPSHVIQSAQSLAVATTATAASVAAAANGAVVAQEPSDHTYTRSVSVNPPNVYQQNGQQPTPPPPYMTTIHAHNIAAKICPPAALSPKTLKVLTVDDLNSRKLIIHHSWIELGISSSNPLVSLFVCVFCFTQVRQIHLNRLNNRWQPTVAPIVQIRRRIIQI